jgi:hypothetical protein
MEGSRPRLKRDWIGIEVRSRRAISNSLGGGQLRRSEPCPRCGVVVRVSKVSEDAVEIVG